MLSAAVLLNGIFETFGMQIHLKIVLLSTLPFLIMQIFVDILDLKPSAPPLTHFPLNKM